MILLPSERYHRSRQAETPLIPLSQSAGPPLAYAAAHGFAAGAIYAAKKVLIRKGLLDQSPARFQRINAAVRGPVCEWRVELPNGAAVGFCGAVDATALSAVLQAVSRLT
jgi:hypothetical protein